MLNNGLQTSSINYLIIIGSKKHYFCLKNKYLQNLVLLFLPNIKTINASKNEKPSAPFCPQSVGEEIQKCVQPVADYAKLLNQQV